MSSPQSDYHDSHTRKRVGKACDRCRLKKSKCDGANPCSRCKIDNAICVFGERKKSHDKVYPKGYVEMLEQQQSQLVAGVREMYTMLSTAQTWPGSLLAEQHDGHPLTHDILERLDVLHMTGENPVGTDAFEDDMDKMQQRLINNGASYVARRSSPSSESEPDLAHADSPHSNATSRISVSSTGSRKRSSPMTPPPPQREEMSIPSKRRFLQGMGLQQNMEVFSEPLIMQSPEFASENSIDMPMFSSFDALGVNTSTDNWSMYSMASLLPEQNQTPGVAVGSWVPDPDFDSFMASGYHGSMA